MDAELVAVRLPPSPAWLGGVEAVWRRGHAVLPLRHDAPDAVVERAVATLRPAAIVDDVTRVARRLDGAVAVADGIALVVVTSGSTGEPKGVELTHDALAASTRASVARLGCRPADRWLLCLPLDHIAGIQVLLRARQLNTEPIVLDRFDVAAVAAADAAHVSLVPTQLARLLDAGVDLTRFATILLGGGTVTPALVERAGAAGGRVVTAYGMTETCGGCVYDGLPLDGVDVEVREDGRIAIRGPVLMHGYRNRPDLTAAALSDGWLLTQDAGRIGRDGRLQLLGRRDDMIVTGGENVSAAAVAAALRTHPDVVDAAATGRADAEWGEVVVAVVVPAQPAAPPTLDDLRAHVATRLGPPAAPRAVVVVPSLPRDAMGKVRAADLARWAARG